MINVPLKILPIDRGVQQIQNTQIPNMDFVSVLYVSILYDEAYLI